MTRDMAADDPLERLDRLADRVRRLAPDRHDPEKFFVDRSEIAHALYRLAKELAA